MSEPDENLLFGSGSVVYSPVLQVICILLKILIERSVVYQTEDIAITASPWLYRQEWRVSILPQVVQLSLRDWGLFVR